MEEEEEEEEDEERIKRISNRNKKDMKVEVERHKR